MRITELGIRPNGCKMAGADRNAYCIELQLVCKQIFAHYNLEFFNENTQIAVG